MKAHSKRVMGVAADKLFGFVYSIGEDGKFNLCEINSHSVVCELTPGKSALTAFIYHAQRAIFIMGDAEGFVYIYNQNTVSSNICNDFSTHPNYN